MLGLVDIEAEVAGSGPSAQAGAIRWCIFLAQAFNYLIFFRYALSMGLRSFVDKETIDDMKLLGKPSCLFVNNFTIIFPPRPSYCGHKSKREEVVWSGQG